MVGLFEALIWAGQGRIQEFFEVGIDFFCTFCIINNKFSKKNIGKPTKFVSIVLQMNEMRLLLLLLK